MGSLQKAEKGERIEKPFFITMHYQAFNARYG